MGKTGKQDRDGYMQKVRAVLMMAALIAAGVILSGGSVNGETLVDCLNICEAANVCSYNISSADGETFRKASVCLGRLQGCKRKCEEKYPASRAPGKPKPGEGRAVVQKPGPNVDRPVVLYSAGERFKTVSVTYKEGFGAGQDAYDTYHLRSVDKMFDVPGTCVEIVNCDPGSVKTITARSEKEAVEFTPSKAPAAPSKDRDNRPWFLRHWMLSMLFALLGFYSVVTVGLSGGPAHGEHPFIMSICHLIGFLYLAQGWAGGYFYSYLVVISGTAALSVYAWSAVGKPQRTRMIRSVMIACYVAMFLIISIKTYAGNAYRIESMGRTMYQVYVPKHDRNKIQALGGKGEVVAEFTLTKGIDCRTVIFWRDETRPGSLKIIPASGSPYVININ